MTDADIVIDNVPDKMKSLKAEEERNRFLRGRQQYLGEAYANCLTSLDRMIQDLMTLKTEVFLQRETFPNRTNPLEIRMRTVEGHVDQSLMRMTKVARKLRKSGLVLASAGLSTAVQKETLSKPKSEDGFSEHQKVTWMKHLENRRIRSK